MYVLDVSGSSNMSMYIDFNHNPNLSDNGAPIRNQGTGVFVAAVEVLTELVLPACRTSDQPYIIWFYTNKSLWPQRRATHYSRVMLTRVVRIGGIDYLAYITDTDANDGRFSSDGVLIDAN